MSLDDDDVQTDAKGPLSPDAPQAGGQGSELERDRGNAAGADLYDSLVQAAPRGWRGLVRRPIVRQWIYKGKLYREAEERVPSRFELFTDLLFVGIIHQLADIAAEDPTGPAVLRFMLTFFPSWSIWLDARNFFNMSGQDDVFQRLWILVVMTCLVGYSVNASAVELEEDHGPNYVRAAIGFFMVAKATRIAGLLSYAYALPRFRISHIGMAAQVFAASIVYLPLIWVTSLRARIAIGVTGIVADYAIKYCFGFVVFYDRLRAMRERRRGTDVPRGPFGASEVYIPAINIEHSIERMSAFTIITLGEMIVNLLYKATAGEIGMKHAFGRATMALITAFLLNWLYFAPGDPGGDTYEHALRRHWFTNQTFTALHWPMCAAIILASSAAARLVLAPDSTEASAATEAIPVGLFWYWGCGIGFALFFMIGIEACHRNLEQAGTRRVPRVLRMSFHFLCALVLILLPLANGTKDAEATAAAEASTTAAVHLAQTATLEPTNSTAAESGGFESHTSQRLDALSIMGITAAVLSCAVIFDYWARRTVLECEPAIAQQQRQHKPHSAAGHEDEALYGVPVDDDTAGPDSGDGDRDLKVACRAGDFA